MVSTLRRYSSAEPSAPAANASVAAADSAALCASLLARLQQLRLRNESIGDRPNATSGRRLSASAKSKSVAVNDGLQQWQTPLRHLVPDTIQDPVRMLAGALPSHLSRIAHERRLHESIRRRQGPRPDQANCVDRPDHIVFVVDDDPRIRESLCELLSSADLHAVPFGSASDYLAYPKPNLPSCLVLDVGLPDINGLELQRRIGEDEHPPIVFITGQGDIPSSVRAIKAGAVDFLTKPFKDTDLLRAIEAALVLSREERLACAGLGDLRQRHSTLTPRERELLPLVVAGLLNKQAAAMLGISEVTTQIHRGHIMRKMRADSLAELVRMADQLEIPINHSRHGNVK
jgi:FixJ family two-component response regulator